MSGALVRDELRMRQLLSHAGTALAGLLFPPQCAACRAPLPETTAPSLCAACRASLLATPGRRCMTCAAAIPPESLAEICAPCAGRNRAFDAAVAVGDYHALLREAVLRTKRPAGEPLALALGQSLAEIAAAAPWSLGVELVAPIPMHWRRRWRRGVNGPDILAEQIAERLGVPLARRALRRRRHTPLQSGVRTELRPRNVRRAFVVTRPDRVARRHVLLVDDIMTSGATCEEAARVLKRSGAAWVAVAVIARAAPGQ